MSLNIRHAYLDSADVVVQVISGGVNGMAHDMLLSTYAAIFGAVRCVQVADNRPIWIGGSYTDGEFTPPPALEPLPEPLPEPPLEPEIT